ncbi:MAG: hypothetical protein J5943_08150 [Oribacterium sp.]|nr:hypothetical protein [Oribacterium sp.]
MKRNNIGFAAGIALTLVVMSCNAALAASDPKPGTRTLVPVHDPYTEQKSLTGVDSQGRPNGMDDATWARLQDDVIDYDEIVNLVEYRSIVAQQQYAAIDNIAVDMNTIVDSLTGSIEDLNGVIADLKDKKNNTSNAAEKEAYDQSIKMISAMISSSKSTDTLHVAKSGAESGLTSSVNKIKMNMHGSKVSVITGMNASFIGYQSLAELEKMYQKQVDMYQTVYDATLRSRAVGMATDLQVKKAEADLKSFTINLNKNKENMRSIRDKMALILGWNSSNCANVSIGAMPPYDQGYIYTRNLDNDIAEARLHNVAYGTAQGTVDKNITGYTKTDISRNEARENLNVSMSDLYNTVIKAEADNAAAQAGYALAARQKGQAERSYAVGTVGNSEYSAALVQYIASEAKANMSQITASAAVLNYQAALKGFV